MQLPEHGQPVVIAVRELVHYRATYDADADIFRLDGLYPYNYSPDAVEHWTPVEWRDCNE